MTLSITTAAVVSIMMAETLGPPIIIILTMIMMISMIMMTIRMTAH